MIKINEGDDILDAFGIHDLMTSTISHKKLYILSEEEFNNFSNELSDLRNCAESWMNDYDRLKNKYEPDNFIHSELK